MTNPTPGDQALSRLRYGFPSLSYPATDWDKQRWIDTILFHARLIENQVIIEEDNFEEGLTPALIAAGIKREDITTSPKPAIVA